MRPAAFLDRDGVLNVDSGYLWRIQDLVWIDGAAAAVRRLNVAGYAVVVVTNQSGIARGLYTEDAMHALHRHMAAEMARQDARIDAFYHCPHHPEHGPHETRDCECRKPKPGMLLRAINELSLDAHQSFLIGDRDTDLAAAGAAAIAAYRFDGGDLDKLVGSILTD